MSWSKLPETLWDNSVAIYLTLMGIHSQLSPCSQIGNKVATLQRGQVYKVYTYNKERKARDIRCGLHQVLPYQMFMGLHL